MLSKHPFLVFLVLMLVVSLACSQLGPAPAAPMDPNAMSTSIALTIAARQTEVVLANPPTATFTPSPVPNTPIPDISPTPTITPSPSVPVITVSVDTNCRTGPGTLYERVGILLVGETTEIVGREPKGEYWYVRNPDVSTEYCWLWGEYASISGNVYGLLMVNQPTPPASMGFTVSFDKVATCSVWWADFILTNKTEAAFRSISLVLMDKDKLKSFTLTSNDFTHNDGCGSPIVKDMLSGNSTLTISSPAMDYNPAGHNLNAKITLCLNEDQSGTCLTQEINFKVPTP